MRYHRIQNKVSESVDEEILKRMCNETRKLEGGKYSIAFRQLGMESKLQTIFFPKRSVKILFLRFLMNSNDWINILFGSFKGYLTTSCWNYYRCTSDKFLCVLIALPYMPIILALRRLIVLLWCWLMNPLVRQQYRWLLVIPISNLS